MDFAMSITSKYLFKLSLGLVAYAAGLVALNWIYRDTSPYKYWLALLPVLPVIYVAHTSLWMVTQMDEMWRKITVEAMAFSGLATGCTCFSYLFIRDMGGTEFRAEWAFYLMWIYYGIGIFFSSRRYQ